MNKILIVDDDQRFLSALAANFRRHRSFEVLEATIGAQALDLVGSHHDIRCILLDYNFDRWGGPNQMNGLEIAEKLKTIAPAIEIIMMSEVAGIREVDAAHRIQHINRFVDKNDFASLLKELESLLGSFDADGDVVVPVGARETLAAYGFHASSPGMADVCQGAMDAAENHLNLLIVGETGVGKTQLARAIHDIGVRNGRTSTTFTPVNCSTIPKELFSSQIFGHRKGMFTGAATDHSGLLEAAGEGTLFLDEITEIPLHVQSELNHALEPGRGTFRRLGESGERRVTARIIAATNENIREAISAGRLRQDLFYRFDQVILIPPLRDRVEDIPRLVDECLGRLADAGGPTQPAIDGEALALLKRQPWLGNVRQLYRVVKRAGYRSRSGRITVDHVQRELRIEYGIEGLMRSESTLTVDLARSQYVRQILEGARGPNREIVGGIDAILKDFRKEIFIEMLKETRGNVAEASRRLERTKLTAWLDELGIDPEEFR